jgi:phosphoglycerate dehydrogenase-like enzyme
MTADSPNPGREPTDGGHDSGAGPGPAVAVGPDTLDWAVEAVRAGGGRVRPLEQAAALVWLDSRDVAGLTESLSRAPSVRWVQLPFAGVEAMADTGLLADGRLWTSAKGAYAEPVAEHALTLAQAGLRQLPTRLRATRWGAADGLSLFDAPVTVVGGGGITRSLLELLAPYRAQVTVVRRSAEPVAGAARTVGTDELAGALTGALVVVLALALTPTTVGLIGTEQLALMRPDAWLVNVARGRHVDTDALVAALRAGQIGGAALDVTDPEPLPDGHPLWTMDNAIITPHTADTPAMVRRLLAGRISDNVRRFAAEEQLIGVVDPAAGY